MTVGTTRKRAALSLAAVFLAGILLGVAGARVYSHRGHGRAHLSPQEYRIQLLEMLDRELDLDQGQAEQVEDILDQISDRFQTVRDAVEPEFQAIRAERAERIMALLDAGQRIRYERILEERQRRRGGNGNRGALPWGRR